MLWYCIRFSVYSIQMVINVQSQVYGLHFKKKLWWALIQIKGLIKIGNEAILWLALFHLLPVNCFLACLKGTLIISKRDRLSVLW